MSEEFRPVVQVELRYRCDACGNGDMIAQKIFPTDPPQWQHECNNCGAQLTLSVRYPTVGHLPDPDAEWVSSQKWRDESNPPLDAGGEKP